MSILVEGYNRVGSADYRLRVLNEEFKHDFPALFQAFTGVLSDDGKALLLPPCKVTVWADAGSLQACLIPTVGRLKAFVGLGDGLTSPWTTLNEALSVGVRWQEGGGQKNK
jgi:hypothetical protein